jgi:hypothetical protein
VTDWVLSTAWYGSFVALVIAAVALVRPVQWVRLRTRRRAAAAVVVALMVIGVAATWRPRTETVFQPRTALDAVAPAYQFREQHSLTIEADPASVMRAVKSVSADDIALFQSFVVIRRFGRSGPESILTAPARQPIVDVATRTTFILLADDAHEIVLGSVLSAPDLSVRTRVREAQAFRSLLDPGVVKAAINFRIEAATNEATRLSTETRVFCTDAEALGRFTPYWRTIFPGSWILRVTWLRAIARRAEAGARSL